MGLPSVMLLPALIVMAAGIYYIYNQIMSFMSKTLVRNKVVVITDAVSGVGAECARLFHGGGARLVLCGTCWDRLESLWDSLTTDADPAETFAPKLVMVDFSDVDSLEDAVTEVTDCYGCVDILICNSSMKLRAPVQNISLDMDRNIMDINYFGPSTLAKGVLPSMISRRSGHIILINSIQGRLAVPFRSSCSVLKSIPELLQEGYRVISRERLSKTTWGAMDPGLPHVSRLSNECWSNKDEITDAASKHAAQAFFDCLRAEVEEFGVTVSTITHTFINTSDLQPPQPAPQTPPTALDWLRTFVSSQLSHGVRPAALANEIVQTVNRKRREVLLAHPLPRVALYLRSLLPPALFAVLAAGVKDSGLSQQM